MKISRRSLWAFLALTLTCASADAQVGSWRETRQEGPIYSRAQLRKMTVLELHLGMPLEDATRSLLQNGYYQKTHRFEVPASTTGKNQNPTDMFFAADGKSWAFLYYTKADDGAATVSYIEIRRPYTTDPTPGFDLDAARKEIVSRYGEPSYTETTLVHDKITRYKLAYTASKNMRGLEDYQTEKISSCLMNWECQKVKSNFDCRDLLAANQAPELEVKIDVVGVAYEWHDFEAQYASLRQNRDFRFMNTKDAVCPVLGVH